MRRILSFGAGLQTTALLILVYKREVEADMIVFADTKGEKPETYNYIQDYSIPLCQERGIPFIWLTNHDKYDGESLYDFSWRKHFSPGMPSRQCSLHFKARVIKRFDRKAQKLVGFSTEELRRAENPVHQGARFPLIELGLSGSDCSRIISTFGWPIPLKSSCFFCPFQRPNEWNWLKEKHPDLFQKALDLEKHIYENKPEKRNIYGLFGGKPLWKFAEGIQQEFDLQENSCWSGACGH